MKKQWIMWVAVVVVVIAVIEWLLLVEKMEELRQRKLT